MNTETIVEKLKAGQWLWFIYPPGSGRVLFRFNYIAHETNGTLCNGTISYATLLSMTGNNGILNHMSQNNSRVLIAPEIVAQWRYSAAGLVDVLSSLKRGEYTRWTGSNSLSFVGPITLLAGSTYYQLSRRRILRNWIESNMETVVL